jgi:hypothetical protein
MLDNYLFASVREGEAPSQPSQPSPTRDSDTQPNYEDARVLHIAAPHWLPPSEVADLYTVSEWKLIVEFSAPAEEEDPDFASLNGEHEYTFKAGKSTLINDYNGSITTLTSDGPGWESVIDGLNGKRYFDEEIEIYVDGEIGTFSLYKEVLVAGEENAEGETSNTVYGLIALCNVIGARAMFYDHGGEIEPVWEIQIEFSGRAYSRSEFDPVPESSYIQTELGTYNLRDEGGGDQIGTINSSEPSLDDAIKMTLSASSFHEDFETSPTT